MKVQLGNLKHVYLKSKPCVYSIELTFKYTYVGLQPNVLETADSNIHKQRGTYERVNKSIIFAHFLGKYLGVRDSMNYL